MSLTSETVKGDEEGEEEEEEEEERYCVCRGPYGNKFMIACDGCEEWFHGSCISINSDQAKNVDKYFCPFCKEKDPSLKTIFKAKVKDKERDKHREKRHKEKLKRRDEKRKREEKRSKHSLDSDSDGQVVVKKLKPELSFKKKSDSRESLFKEEHKKAKKFREEMRLKSSKEDLKIKPKDKDDGKAKHSEEPKSKLPLPEVGPKIRPEFGPKMKPEVSLKIKPEMGPKTKPEIVPKTKLEESVKFKNPKEAESVRTKTVKIKEEKEVRVPTPAVLPEEPIVKKKEKKKEEVKVKIEGAKEKKDEEKKIKAEEPTPSSKPRKTTPPPKPSKATPPSKPSKSTPPSKPANKATPPSKPSKASTDSDDEDADFNVFLNALSKQSKAKAAAVSSSEDEDVDVGMDDVVVESSKKPTKSVVKEQPVKPVKPVSTQGRKRVLKKKGRPKKLTGAKNDVVGGQNDKESSEEEERQCLGPGCCNAARSRSRYCSDDCGVKLAVKRIRTFLPERKEEMKRGGTARRFDEEQISALEQQQTVAHQKILELQNQRLVIMNLIGNAKATVLDNNSEEDLTDEEVPADNEEVDCVICGMACTDKNAVRHMERCYNKFESKLGLGSTVKCHVTWESPVCDAYDRQQGTYCKKLRVLCPDHNKEKEEHDGICGCPLDLSNITENSAVCHKGKRACNKHTSWEKLRLAEIDMERVLQDLKLEDSFEEMRKVKYRMAHRTNLLQILLNGTICHNQESQSSVT